jgi:hypothetical protein
MGISEWGIQIKNQADLQHIIDLVKLHNECSNQDIVGEELVLCAILKYNENLYVCLGNGGGRDLTSRFLRKNYSGKSEIYLPFNKPDWWHDTKNCIWRSSSGKPIESVF